MGLGNPGDKYRKTRHNVGFLVVEHIADHCELISSWELKHTMMFARVKIKEQVILLVKPQTFMNDSGWVVSFLKKQGIVLSRDGLVVHDELELPFGSLKIRLGGSARGHNGLKSIIAMSDSSFRRLRFGIGRPLLKEAVSQYVLEQFNQEELGSLPELLNQALAMIEEL
ncbi:MAG: aminoacyl-tRNA hydrolase [Candidatus Babeliales bacterium]